MLYSAEELMAKTGCKSLREYRGWLRKQGIKHIDAPAGPIVPHEALLEVLGLRVEAKAPEFYDPALVI